MDVAGDVMKIEGAVRSEEGCGAGCGGTGGAGTGSGAGGGGGAGAVVDVRITMKDFEAIEPSESEATNVTIVRPTASGICRTVHSGFPSAVPCAP